MWVIFAFLDLDPDPRSDCESGSGNGSRDPNESGSRSGSTTLLATTQLMTGWAVWHPSHRTPHGPHLILAAAPATSPPSCWNLTEPLSSPVCLIKALNNLIGTVRIRYRWKYCSDWEGKNSRILGQGRLSLLKR